jgi:hypothetical protein
MRNPMDRWTEPPIIDFRCPCSMAMTGIDLIAPFMAATASQNWVPI